MVRRKWLAWPLTGTSWKNHPSWERGAVWSSLRSIWLSELIPKRPANCSVSARKSVKIDYSLKIMEVLRCSSIWHIGILTTRWIKSIFKGAARGTCQDLAVILKLRRKKDRKRWLPRFLAVKASIPSSSQPEACLPLPAAPAKPVQSAQIPPAPNVILLGWTHPLRNPNLASRRLCWPPHPVKDTGLASSSCSRWLLARKSDQ